MKKCLLFLIIFYMASAVSFSNVIISGKHKGKMIDGKKVDCSYCHFSGVKVAQKKGQMKDKKLNGVSLSAIKGCAGKECHH